MEKKKYFGTTLTWHWIRTGVFLLLFGEYTRLLLTTDAPTYRVIVTGILGIIFTCSLITLICAHLRTAKDST